MKVRIPWSSISAEIKDLWPMPAVINLIPLLIRLIGLKSSINSGSVVIITVSYKICQVLILVQTSTTSAEVRNFLAWSKVYKDSVGAFKIR